MKLAQFLIILFIFQTGCSVGIKPVRMDVNPREEERKERQETDEQTNVEAFITAHPELTPEMKRDLRTGVLSRPAALEQLNKK